MKQFLLFTLAILIGLVACKKESGEIDETTFVDPPMFDTIFVTFNPQSKKVPAYDDYTASLDIIGDNIIIDWGDGVVNAEKTHNYGKEGRFNAIISGSRIDSLDLQATVQISNLNIDQAKSLKHLNISYHSILGSLNLSNNLELVSLVAFATGIDRLDLSKQSQLRVLEISPYSNGDEINVVHLKLGIHPELTILSFDDVKVDGEINLKQYPKLEVLACGGYKLATNFDFSLFPNLKHLSCINSQLTILDVSKNANLETLRCGGLDLHTIINTDAILGLIILSSSIKEFDASKYPRLIDLYLEDNKQLETLKLEKSVYLSTLGCVGSPIRTINLEECSSINNLICSKLPYLEEIDLSSCTSIARMDVSFNSLKRIAPPLTLCSHAHIHLNNNLLSIQEIDKIINLLPKVEIGFIYVQDNPGAEECNSSIANEKGFLVL